MEKMNEFQFRISRWILDTDPDFKELVMWFSASSALPTTSIPVNDETSEPYHAYLSINEDTNEVITGFVLGADNLFDDIARAFANRDLNHPDVRFFLEKKFELYAERHRDELEPQPEPILP